MPVALEKPDVRTAADVVLRLAEHGDDAVGGKDVDPVGEAVSILRPEILQGPEVFHRNEIRGYHHCLGARSARFTSDQNLTAYRHDAHTNEEKRCYVSHAS